MFDFIRKPLLWDAWDSGLDNEICTPEIFHLKSIQDLAIYMQLRETEGKLVAEIGGGNSRLLKVLAKKNRCANVERFEGVDGGPSEEIKIAGVENIPAFLGEFSEKLKADSFDVVFSISVVEHVPNTELQKFFDDGIRILKPGGIWLHAIDLYVEDAPNSYQESRFEAYRAWLSDSRLSPIGPVFSGPFLFTCDIATNPDNVMYKWGQLSPTLVPLRQRAQSISVLVGAQKK